jgi:hypothetical protein
VAGHASDPAEVLQDPSLREKLLGFLGFRVGLVGGHRFLLPQSAERYADGRDNAEETQRLRDAVADRSVNGRRELEAARQRGGPRPDVSALDEAT